MRHTFIAVTAVCLSALLLIACDTSSKDTDINKMNNRSVVSASHVKVDEAQTPDLESGVHDDKPLLRWAKPGMAPLFIGAGAERDRGVGDQMFGEIQELMPQYNHVNLNLNYSRLLEELRKGSNVCAILHLSLIHI